MLIQFNFKNFKSFKDETSFDMTAASIKEHSYNLIDIGTNDKYLKVAAIYGANASGKSNIIDAYRFMNYFVITSFNEDNINIETKKRNIPVKNFTFDLEGKNNSSSFEVFFVEGNFEYQYGFVVDHHKVYEEWLYYKKPQHKTFKRIFYREQNTIKCEEYFKDEEIFKDSVGETVLFLSLLAKTKSKKAFNIYFWFIKSQAISFGSTWHESYFSNWQNSAKKSFEDNLYKVRLEEYLVAIDTGISGFRVEETKQADTTYYNVYTQHNTNNSDVLEEISLFEESSGTQKMFVLFEFIHNAFFRGEVIFIDELDAKLHPLLLRYIITMFHNKDINIKNAQLIFSTHDVSNLTKDLFRRDQIWFTEKDEYGLSSLYSLVEYRDDNSKIRNDATYNKDYISGRYGAIPLFKEFNLMGEEK